MWGAAWCQDAWDAVGQAITANIPEALATLAAAVTVAGTTLLAAGTCAVAGVTANATAVFNVLSSSLPTLICTTVAEGRLATAVVTNTVAALSAGNIEGASNAAVGGPLGPTGLPGTVLHLSIGQGVQIAPITGATRADIQTTLAASFAPIILPELQSATRQIVAALQTPNPVPPGRLYFSSSALLAERLLLVETTPEAILHTTTERTTGALATTLTGCARRPTTLERALRRRTGDGEHDATEHHQETDHR